jgi:hypothetical protein
MCCLLGIMVACLLVPCTSPERSCDMVPGASASARAQQLALQTPTSHQAGMRFFEQFAMVRDGKGSQFMHLLRNALHLTLSSARLYCHLSTAPMPCYIKKCIVSIFRAGLLEPHGPESCTWHNRDLIGHNACADAS